MADTYFKGSVKTGTIIIDPLAVNPLIKPDDGTATAVAGDSTLNKMAGVITSEALTTAAGAEYTLIINNTKVTPNDLVFASVRLNSATTGTPCITKVIPQDQYIEIHVQNVHASAAFNGTINVSYIMFTA
jgi:hypothetical protein